MKPVLLALALLVGFGVFDVMLFDGRYVAAIWQQANYTGSRFASNINLWADRVLRK
jgi:hypothetical protein